MNYLIVTFIVKLRNGKKPKFFISNQRTSLFLFTSTVLLVIFVWYSFNNRLLTCILSWFIIVSTFISSCRIVMENLILRLFILTVLLLDFLLLLLFFLWFYLFTFNKLFESLSLKSILSFLKILFVLEMIIADKLFLGYFYNFIFIHTPCVKSFRTSHALINWHCVSTNSAGITVMKRTSEMHGVCINIFEQLFSIILFDTFWMEKFGTICSWTFCQLILLFTLSWCLLNNLITFSFSFFILLVFSAIIVTFTFTN